MVQHNDRHRVFVDPKAGQDVVYELQPEMTVEEAAEYELFIAYNNYSNRTGKNRDKDLKYIDQMIHALKTLKNIT